ncbi:hypothetical protein O181_034037 [Austropuccinia psidii MF-1]|uniref:Uncharacterized protein n=1 Tax=Austropuccinia psidii MF-1 TaxID=1389203 RepID=A0A9Q3H7Q0_9BASI|nr:hypothetical protein [Austropuccinia psidii MF-1]
MEDARTYTRIFDTFLGVQKLKKTAIPVVRSEHLLTIRSGNIPVSVQELVYGGKAARVGASSQLLDRDNELLPSSKEGLGPRKKQELLKGCKPMSCKRKLPKINIL